MSNKKISCGGFFIDDTLKEEDGVLSVVGGGSSSLPEVTSEDNGDVLTVVEGAWTKAEPSGGDIFFVTITGTGEQPDYYVYTSDKTFEEIDEAYNSGKTVLQLVLEPINASGVGKMFRIQDIEQEGQYCYYSEVLGTMLDEGGHTLALCDYSVVIRENNIDIIKTYGTYNGINHIIF